MTEDDFWDDFVARVYRRTPYVVDAERLSAPGFSMDDAMRAIEALLDVNACNWTDGRAYRLENPRVPRPLAASLRNFARFSAEVRELNGVPEFVFSQHNCHAFVPALHRRAASFLAPLFRRVGLPSNGVNIVLLAGHYTKTPAGLHNDPADIFLFPLVGSKRLLTWPFELFDDGAGLVDGKIVHRRLPDIDYREHLAECTVLEARPGQAVYFPAGTWHINDFSDAADSVALAVSVFCNFDLEGVAGSIADEAYEVAAQRAGSEPTWSELTSAFRRTAQINYLQRLTAGGFVTGMVESEDVELQEGTELRARPSSVALLADSNDTNLLVANGHAMSIPSTASLDAFLRAVVDGDWVSVADSRFADGHEDVVAVAQVLWRTGAVELR